MIKSPLDEIFGRDNINDEEEVYDKNKGSNVVFYDYFGSRTVSGTISGGGSLNTDMTPFGSIEGQSFSHRPLGPELATMTFIDNGYNSSSDDESEGDTATTTLLGDKHANKRKKGAFRGFFKVFKSSRGK